MDAFQIGEGVYQGCILGPCLFNLYAEYIMGNTELDESQARVKIAGKNSNNLRYADDTTLMAESQQELKNFLRRVKEENEKAGLNLTFKKTDHGIQSHHFGKQMEKNWKQWQILFSWAPKSLQTVTANMNLKDTCP